MPEKHEAPPQQAYSLLMDITYHLGGAGLGMALAYATF